MSAPSWEQVLQEISRGSRESRHPMRIGDPDETEAAPERWERFERISGLLERLTRTEQKLELAPLPAGDTNWDEARPGNVEHNLRKEAVVARLKLLGYTFEQGSGALREAVRRFQKDAGLEVDGWVGRLTWEALDELITLEPPLKLERWHPIGEHPFPALVRATALRLRTLGFDVPLTDVFEELRGALFAFKEVALALGFSAGEEFTDREAVALIFDDELLLSIAEREREGEAVLADALSLDEPETDATSRLLRRMVRGELWLHGYEVGDLRASTQTVAGQKGLADGLRAFWRQRGVPSGPELEERSKRIDRELFHALVEDHRGPDGGDAEHEWVARFVSENRVRLREAWERAIPCRPVFFIWDGMKRCGRWLKGHLQAAGGRLVSLAEVLGRGLEYAKTFVWNVVRFVFQQGSRILTTVRRAVAAFIDGVQPFLDGGVRFGAGAGLVECRLGLDFDVSMVVGHVASPEHIDDMRRRMARMTLCLQVGTAILGDFLQAEQALSRGPGGWMAFLSRLVQDAPGWEQYLVHLAKLPDLPKSNPMPTNRSRLLLFAAGALAPLAVAGIVGLVSGAGAFEETFQRLKSWAASAGVPVGVAAVGLVLAWALWRWLPSRVRMFR